MDTDLASRLDRSIGPAPSGPDPLAAVLAHGKRTVRRRRIAGTVAATAAALVVVGGAALATSGGPDRAAPPVVDAPPARSATPLPSTESLVRWDVGCELVVDPTATVLERVENPYGVGAPARSTALIVRDGAGGTTWWATYCSERGSAALFDPASGPGGTFESWVAAQAGMVSTIESDRPSGPGDAPQGQPADDLVRFAGDTEQLVALNGAELLEQRPGVDVGADFAGPGDRTAAGRLRTALGDELFVLVRAFAGEPRQAISVPVGSVAGADLDAFLAYARAAYSGGGGLL